MKEINKRIEELSLEKLKLLTKQIFDKKKRQTTTIRPGERIDNCFPLSNAQELLWFLDQLTPSDISYNVPQAIHLNGWLDLSALERALNEIVRRHEILRTNFVNIDGQ